MERNDYFKLPLEDELSVLMRQCGDLMIKLADKNLGRIGLSTIHVAILFTIKYLGNEATPRRLSRSLLREPHTISKILNHMEKQGLIKRVNDLPRKNMVRIEMTDKGKRVYSKDTNKMMRTKIMSALTEKEKKELRIHLVKIRGNAIKLLGNGYNLSFPPANF